MSSYGYLPIDVSDQGDAYARDKWHEYLASVERDFTEAGVSVSELATIFVALLRDIRIKDELDFEHTLISILLAFFHGLKEEVNRKENDGK